MADIRIFYSWQSDLPNATNRGFVASALEKAVKRIHTDDALGVTPVVDRDTQGIPGAPDIVHAIFDKIEHSHVFVSDVSIINSGTDTRPTPNPNVLIELGYALRHLGPNRVLLVLNTHFGDPEQLPFDLKLKRVIAYNSSPETSERAAERERLSRVLESSIRSILALSKPSGAAVVFDGGASEMVTMKHVFKDASLNDKDELAARVVCLNLELQNLGESALTDIECFLEFPENLMVLDENQMRARWSAYPNDVLEALAKKIGDPQTIGEMLSETFGFGVFQMQVGARSARPKYSPRKDAKADVSSRDARYQIRKLKHAATQTLEPLYVWFPPWSSMSSFLVNYRIHADTLIAEGQLKVVI